MSWKNSLFAFLILMMLFASGCGKDEALEKYYDEMSLFADDINVKFDVLNSIDPASESAVEEMLEALNDLTTTFQNLAAIEVPREFSANESLADEAADYMAEAARLYHEAYADGTYQEYAAEAAQENYNRAVKRIDYISMILQGEVPEDSSVTVITETESSGFWGDQE